MKFVSTAAAMIAALSGCAAKAQSTDMPMDHAMPGMNDMINPDQHEPGGANAHHAPYQAHTTPQLSVVSSGTSRLPGAEGEMTGLHSMAGSWMLMAHGYAWGVYSDQGGPRGDSKTFMQSMAMFDAEGPVSDQTKLQLRAMLSLEPLMSHRGYPNLFATGETANGVALVDRQHPHDFFMELSGRFDFQIGAGSSFFVYGGPVAEPALGPTAFMHRGSARYNPEAPISHHWFDSTHITFGVVTAGVSTRHWQLEASAFRGREPDEHRWNIETPKLDSWSVRASWSPSPQWLAQISYGHLNSPEALHPDENEGRFTASVSFASRALNVTAGYARKDRLPGPVFDAWLAEANYQLTSRHNLFGRIELVENDELFGEASPLHGDMFRVGKFTGGYAYRLPLSDLVNLAIGGSGSLYAVPSSIEPFYGRSPKSFTLFAKLSLGG